MLTLQPLYRSVLGGVTAADSALLDNLLFYYKFEADGTDSHTSGYNLTLVNTPTFVTGEVGNAMDLESSSDMKGTNAAFNDLNGTNKGTFMCWFNGETVNDAHTMVGQFLNTGANGAIWMIQVNLSSILVYVSDGATYNNSILTDGSIISAATIYHLRVAFDLAQGTELDRIKIWIDGTLITARSVDTGTIPTSFESNDIDLQFGAWGVASSDFDGWMDEAGLWSSVLTDAEADLHRLKTGLPY